MKNVIVIVPRHHKESSADLYERGRGEIPENEPYEWIELDSFKTIYRRKEVLDTLRKGWTVIETTDETMLYILRVKRMRGEIDNLELFSNEGRCHVDEDGRMDTGIPHSTIDDMLDELLMTRVGREKARAKR